MARASHDLLRLRGVATALVASALMVASVAPGAAGTEMSHTQSGCGAATMHTGFGLTACSRFYAEMKEDTWEDCCAKCGADK